MRPRAGALRAQHNVAVVVRKRPLENIDLVVANANLAHQAAVCLSFSLVRLCHRTLRLGSERVHLHGSGVEVEAERPQDFGVRAKVAKRGHPMLHQYLPVDVHNVCMLPPPGEQNQKPQKQYRDG